MMDSASFVGDTEGEARLLLLIDAFTGPNRTLQGRVKLAKLDFLLRYPQFARRALAERNRAVGDEPEVDEDNIEGRMVRYRYGPWDPAYYALLGSLLGRGLIETVPEGRYTGLRTTDTGRAVAAKIAEAPAWKPVADRAKRLSGAFRTQTGTWLMKFVYETFPEVTSARWGEQL
jgi:hypothetical protein